MSIIRKVTTYHAIIHMGPVKHLEPSEMVCQMTLNVYRLNHLHLSSPWRVGPQQKIQFGKADAQAHSTINSD